MNSLLKRLDNTYIKTLDADPESNNHLPNKTSREVKSGHYVLVTTTTLPDPKLIIFSQNLADTLQIPHELVTSSDMLLYLSGNEDFYKHNKIPTWATPYALSIYGTEMTSNCPFRNGNGYGDGRAHSIGQLSVSDAHNITKTFELQLKGSGKTPFSRSGDGRAVLRSSIREFLASEAMFHLGVPTTRALSLVISQSEKVHRESYKGTGNPTCSLKSGTCSKQKPHEKESNENQTAIVCRVSESLIRVGHFELFSRRLRDKTQNNSLQYDQLVKLLIHTVESDFPHLTESYPSLSELVFSFLRESATRMSIMVAEWLRVGYVQSNFNSDNCLVGGRTMDYGPFGFIEKYDPNKNFWIGGGSHFSFMNQPAATRKNFKSLAASLKPLLDPSDYSELSTIIEEFDTICVHYVNDMWRRKLGFCKVGWGDGVSTLFNKLDYLLETHDVDWTIFWRELTYYPKRLLDEYVPNVCLKNFMSGLIKAFYQTDNMDKKGFYDWLEEYRNLLLMEGSSSTTISSRMKALCPKYIPREWMLKEAYTTAENGDYRELHRLHEVFTSPYSEQPEMESVYYKLSPLDKTINDPGVTHMTCAS